MICPYLKGRCVDIDVFNECKFPPDLCDRVLGLLELHFHPVADAAMFALEGRCQGLFWKPEAEGELTSACRECTGLSVIYGEEKQNIMHVI